MAKRLPTSTSEVEGGAITMSAFGSAADIEGVSPLRPLSATCGHWSVTDAEISRTLTQVGDVTVCRPFIGQARYGRNQTRLGVRYWQRRPLSLHFLFNDKAQYQKRYWPNSYPNSQPLCMSFLKDRS